MGREFLDLFEAWADSYDQSVEGYDQEYREVFANYEEILNTVATKAGKVVLEFGVGTGNLTKKLLEQGKKVYGIEPSAPMRKKAYEKLGGHVSIEDGDFLQFPLPQEPIDTIVSTYAFHHLTDEEKREAIANYGKLLAKGGKIVFADTAFRDRQAFERAIEEARKRGFHNLADDLQREYYTTLDVLTNLFETNGFTVTFAQHNAFVWVMEAIKQ
ncbi:class I SAM-dependent methyltransferase [Thermaerobacillus caldiproteolyticus]|uniref:class I SAM-dependent methyltransferase n=1 Tax=Thermaerobacillus caldiproteolyticus TaxID=247480 RepID=UPI0018F23495|nr:class I SAM-dependent methyltransferase [Anoxybacillus caldiproteolyticus]